MVDGAELLSKKNEKLVIVEKNLVGYFTGHLRFEKGKEYIELSLNSCQKVFEQIEAVEYFYNKNNKWKAL
jgi:hypothetical protein